MSSAPDPIWAIVLSAALAIGTTLAALAAALVLSQRRIIALQQQHTERLLEAQERERAWVAREVHDDALQRIALVLQELQELDTAGEEASWRVDAVRDEIRDLAMMLRQLAHRLHPAVIEQAGLGAALRNLAHDLSRTNGLMVDLQVPEFIGSLKPEPALHLFRITQEALRNVATHAEVAAATVRLTTNAAQVELVIEDHGKGFVVDEQTRARGLGLVSMQERARLAGGQLEIESAPGEGTRVIVRLRHDGVAT